jgi:Cu-Zn family superoxide dismutase
MQSAPADETENLMSTTSTDSRRSRSKVVRLTLGTAALAGAMSLAATSGSVSGDGWDAEAVLRDVDGNKVGKVKFEGDRHGTVVKATLKKIAVGLDGYHGFHLHANDAGGQCDPTASAGPFTNVGGHWNPTATAHGSHAGDLPSIQVLSDGTGYAKSVTGRFDPHEIEGRAVILHAGPDNFANIPTRYATGEPAVAGPDAATLGAGDAGGRIACGIVELDD